MQFVYTCTCMYKARDALWLICTGKVDSRCLKDDRWLKPGRWVLKDDGDNGCLKMTDV